TRVFNASLLAAETLASVAALTNEEELREWAVRGARYVVRRQREDGSWSYGADNYQSWADNFHTAFVLTSLTRIMEACGE
ncbi:MAG: delta-aminolevulinic acid dehydratase, partial [Pyrinomonadaceae bacterium]